MSAASFSPCESQNLALIQERFGAALLLTVEQTAQLLGTTGNNVAQLLRRGHVPFDAVRVGSRVLFPVPLVAAWLCGAVVEKPLAVSLPKKTASRVRSSSDLRARLFALRVMVKQREQALREADDAQGFKEAREAWGHASAQVVAMVEREALRKRAGLGVGSDAAAL
jgi:excisionase family DNA binding protein